MAKTTRSKKTPTPPQSTEVDTNRLRELSTALEAAQAEEASTFKVRKTAETLHTAALAALHKVHGEIESLLRESRKNLRERDEDLSFNSDGERDYDE